MRRMVLRLGRQFLRHLAAALTTVAVLAGLPVAAVASSTTIDRLGAGVSQPQVSDAPVGRVLTAIAGSATFFVYSEFAVNDGKRSPTGTLFAKTLKGTPRRIATIRHAAYASLAGSMLVYDDGTTAPILRWRNLKTGAHGTANLPSKDGFVAAPDGWILVHDGDGPGPEVLSLHTLAGKTTNLGSPNPNGTTFNISESATTLVTYTSFVESTNGSASLLSFADPTRFHRFIPRDSRGLAFCPSVTDTRIACHVAGNGAGPERLYTTAGKLLTSATQHCPSTAPAVLGDSLAWITPSNASCPKNRLIIMSPHGVFTTGTGRYTGTPIAAFGKIIVGAHRVAVDQYRQLILVSNATHRQVFISAK